MNNKNRVDTIYFASTLFCFCEKSTFINNVYEFSRILGTRIN